MKFILTFIIVTFWLNTLFSQNWITESEDLLNNEFHQKSIDLIFQNIDQSKLSSIQKSTCYQILADNYLIIGETEKFKDYSILSFKSIENKKGLDSSLYYSNLGVYYHYLLRVDSATFYAVKSLQFLESNFKTADSTLISRIYSAHGNCMRNASHDFSWVKKDYILKDREHSITYLKKSLLYANAYQKPYVLRILGTIYNDIISVNKYRPHPFKGKYKQFNEGVNYYYQAIALGKKNYENPNKFISRCYSLLGLTYQYNYYYNDADSLYNIAIDYSSYHGKIRYLNEYNTASSLKGWNDEEMYNKTKDIQYLYKSLTTYESSVNSWLSFYHQVSNKNKGLDDAYRISTIQKIPGICYSLFQLTNDSSYIDKALYYGDLDRYPTYLSKKKTKDPITVKKLQQNLKNDETIVFYLSSNNPDKIHSIIISKTKVHFINHNHGRIRTTNYDGFNGFTTPQEFRYVNYSYYNMLFKSVDSVLTLSNSKNIIIVPSPEFSQLNFDLLISDTLSNKWKDYPYMFHKYNFSYELNGSILMDNHLTKKTNTPSIGIINGEFNNKSNLLFSNKLMNWINDNYTSTISFPTNIKKFEDEVNKHNVILLIGHGKGNYTTSNSSIYLNDSVHIDSDNLMNMDFNNGLFITTACNTNQSSTYISEGLTGGFSKSLIYSGVNSTITTHWEIDDKTNLFIMKRLLHHLSEGQPKSVSLWLSKKEYWNSCKQDEEFKPFYWSPYRLTGNTSAIVIKNKMSFNYYYLLFLLIFPLGIFVKRKWFI